MVHSADIQVVVSIYCLVSSVWSPSCSAAPPLQTTASAVTKQNMTAGDTRQNMNQKNVACTDYLRLIHHFAICHTEKCKNENMSLLIHLVLDNYIYSIQSKIVHSSQ